MPGRPLRQCTYPGCSELTGGKVARCEKHPYPVWEKKGVQVKRMTGNPLREARKRLFRTDPLCVMCATQTPPRVTLATQRDHIVPLQEGGLDVPENTQGLCDDCHEIKSKAERERGLISYHRK